MSYQLRPYQQESLDALWKWFSNNVGNPLVVIPTGGGKSLMIAALIQRVLSEDAKARIVVATHARELVQQNYDKFKALEPKSKAGIYASGLGKKEINSQILFASIQSIFKKAVDIQQCDLLLIDEAHTISRKEMTMWGKFIKDLKCINPELRIVGYTATAWRMDSGSLIDGDDRIFHDIAHEVKMSSLIDQRYLCPLVSRQQDIQIDLARLPTRMGDYEARALATAAGKITVQAVADLVAQGANRNCWLAFCTSVEHSVHVRDEIRSYGIKCETVTGKTPGAERDKILNDLRKGRIRCVTNCGCLTTGVDIPMVDLLCMLRPTQSSGLLLQMAGRGIRIHPSKNDCLFLDYAGLLAAHGPIDKIEPPRRKIEGDGSAPTKVCLSCDAEVHISAKFCPHCLSVFDIIDTTRLTQSASTDAVLSTQIQPFWWDVGSIDYHVHKKPGSPDSLQLTYWCGMTPIKEWVCLDHPGFPRKKAEEWWSKRGNKPYPSNTAEAMLRKKELKHPSRILIRKEGKYYRVIGEEFESKRILAS